MLKMLLSARAAMVAAIAVGAVAAAPILAQSDIHEAAEKAADAAQDVVEKAERADRANEDAAEKPVTPRPAKVMLPPPPLAPPPPPAPPPSPPPADMPDITVPPLPPKPLPPKPLPPKPLPPSSTKKKNFTKPHQVLASKDGRSLHFVGDITARSAANLKDVLKKNPDAEILVLSSNGGLVIEGLALGNVISKNKLKVHVETVCASACTLAFLKSRERTMTKAAVLGFHQASRGSHFKPIDDDNAGDNAGNRVMINAYRAAGAHDYIIDNALKTPPRKMWFVNGSDIVKNVPGTELREAGEIDFPKGIWWSADDLRSKLYDEPIWKLLAKDRPDIFYSAFAEIWNHGILSKELDDAMENGRIERKKRLYREIGQYPDDVILSLISIESDFWAGFKERRNNSCMYAGIRQVPIAVPVTAELMARETAAARRMLDSATSDILPASDEMDDAAARVMEFWGVMIAETDMNSYNVKRKFCREPKLFYEKLSALPEAKRVEIFRALLTPEYRNYGR